MDMDQKSTVVEARFHNSRQENFIQSHTRSDSQNSSRYSNPRLANTNNSRSASYHLRSSSRGHTRTPSMNEIHRNTSICIDDNSVPQPKENNDLFDSTSSFVKTHNRYGTHSTITSLSRKDSSGSYLSDSSETKPLLESSTRERARKTINTNISTLNSESFQKSSSQQGIPPPSPSSSIRSVNQFTHIHKKRLSRTIQHISSFIQINVNINSLPTISFPVTVEKAFTVERLARQIEAEYAFKFEQVGLCVPLEVGLLYDVGMVALRFQDIIGDVLEHGDVVNVLNIYEGYNPSNIEDVGTSKSNMGWSPNLESFTPPPLDDEESSPKEQRHFSLPVPTRNQSVVSPVKVTDHLDTSTLVVPPLPSPALSSPRSPDIPQPTTQHIQNIIQASEARFQAVLSNTLALSVFQNFTIREYSTENLLFWLDVELFAAGISSDGEDNYYDDDEQQTALIHAKYIYLTYISQNAPLQVNLSDEIRREIPWPLDDNFQVERNMFDEAQEAVYQLMKGHTFMRFEESNEWKECLRIKTEHPEEYEKHEMTESLENYFRPSMSLMMAVTMTLDNEAPPIPISYHYKEQTLYSTLTQYFPKTPQLDNAGKKTENESPSAALHPKTLQGYFNAENRLTTAQRMRRIKKERKLQWVFGEKVVKIAGQFSADPKDQLFDEADDVSSISSILTENRRAAKNVWNRKRKIEKLESIFGRGLKDSQQQLFKRESIFSSGSRDSAISAKSSSPDDRFPQAANELSTKDRRMLWKKSKKLKVILGESLDEELVRQTLTLPIKQTSPTKERYGISRRASDPMLPITPTSASSFVDSPEGPPSSSNRSISTRRRSGSWDSSKFSINTSPMHVNEDTKEYRRKKLQKLYQFLGEKVPVNVALGENSVPSDSLPPVIKNKHKGHRQKPSSLTRKSNKPNSNSNYENLEPIHAIRLSAQDKKRHLHRAVKLERMFGEVPPQNLIMTSTSSSTWPPSISNMDAHHRNIMSLDYLMENDRETIYELIDYMATSDDDEEYSSDDDLDTLHRHVSSAPVTPSATQPPSPVSKQIRLKGIRKLSHFFGATYGQMFPDQVLGEILVEIEREIRYEASANQNVDRAMVDGLVGKLEELRAKSSELTINSVEKKLHDGTTSEEDAAYTTEEEQYSNVGTSSQTNNYYNRRRGSADSDSVLLTVM